MLTVQAVITSSSSARLRWVGRGGLCLCCIWKGWFGFAGRPRQLSARHRKSGFMCCRCLTELSFSRNETFSLLSSPTQLHFVHICTKEALYIVVTRGLYVPKKDKKRSHFIQNILTYCVWWKKVTQVWKDMWVRKWWSQHENSANFPKYEVEQWNM